jgi:hypothetical protein
MCSSGTTIDPDHAHPRPPARRLLPQTSAGGGVVQITPSSASALISWADIPSSSPYTYSFPPIAGRAAVEAAADVGRARAHLDRHLGHGPTADLRAQHLRQPVERRRLVRGSGAVRVGLESEQAIRALKPRLVQVLKDCAAGTPHTRLECRCFPVLPAHRPVSLHRPHGTAVGRGTLLAEGVQTRRNMHRIRGSGRRPARKRVAPQVCSGSNAALDPFL